MDSVPCDNQHPCTLETRRSHCVYEAVDLVDVVVVLVDLVGYLPVSSPRIHIVPVGSNQVKSADKPRERRSEEGVVWDVERYESVRSNLQIQKY